MCFFSVGLIASPTSFSVEIEIVISFCVEIALSVGGSRCAVIGVLWQKVLCFWCKSQSYLSSGDATSIIVADDALLVQFLYFSP
jgi:hypothetical protein